MTLTRRTLLGGLSAVGGVTAFGLASEIASAAPSPASAKDPSASAKNKGYTIGEDGLYHQDWFVQSFLDLRDDIKEAADAGKHFAIVWEQRGCPYCRELHRVNFAQPAIRKYIKANFNILQLDLWGPRKVTDFDGKEMGERELASRWGINFTPTMNFFPKDPVRSLGKTGRQAEVIRMPGYLNPFHFVAMFEYMSSDRSEEISFQRFVQEKGDKLREQGKPVELWDK